jgi:hypothetical protein
MFDRLDFAIVGAAKAGTTTLFEYLRGHPDVFIPPEKELPYFFGVRREFDKYYEDARDYHARHFGDGCDDKLAGVVTPQYMYGAPADGALEARADESAREIPHRLQQFAPSVKLVAILRDPVSRAHSHFQMNVLRGLEKRSFEEAVETLLDREQLRLARLRPNERTCYVVAGEYGRILGGYADVFARDRLHVVFTRDLADDAPAVMRGICSFIGADPSRLAPTQIRPANRGAARRRINGLDLLSTQRAVARSSTMQRAWHRLPTQARLGTAARFEAVAGRLATWNRAPGAAPPPSAMAVEALRAHYADDEMRLQELLGQPAPWHS